MSCSLIDMEKSILNREVGRVLDLFVSKKGDSKRSKKIEIIVDKDGVIEDKFYAKDSQRSILITTTESYELANKKDIFVERGLLGENILIDYNPYHLSIGSKIIMGEVILEITQNCTLCKSLTKVDKKLPKLLKDDRGIFAKVIKSGVIKIDDTVYV